MSGTTSNTLTFTVQRSQKRREKTNLFEDKMTENFFFKLVKETDIQVREVQQVPNKMNSKRPTPILTIIKMAKLNFKRKNFTASKRKTKSNIQGTHIRLSADL